jgi:hypothetical protein
MIAKGDDQNQIDNLINEEDTHDLSHRKSDIQKSKITDTTFNPLLVQHG